MNQNSSPGSRFEAVFDTAYLLFDLIAGMILLGKGNTPVLMLYGLLALELGAGDAVSPRPSHPPCSAWLRSTYRAQSGPRIAGVIHHDDGLLPDPVRYLASAVSGSSAIRSSRIPAFCFSGPADHPVPVSRE